MWDCIYGSLSVQCVRHDFVKVLSWEHSSHVARAAVAISCVPERVPFFDMVPGSYNDTVVISRHSSIRYMA